MSDKQFIQQAISLATENVKVGGRPFGAVIVKNGQVIAHAVNQITATNDPTAHAELLALREAGKVLGRAKLDDCVVYASGQPCPMCLAAMRMAGISQIFYAYSKRKPPLRRFLRINRLINLQQPFLLSYVSHRIRHDQ